MSVLRRAVSVIGRLRIIGAECAPWAIAVQHAWTCDAALVRVGDPNRRRQTMAGNLLIHNVRPRGASATDILIRGGTIAAVGPYLPAEGAAVLDGGGRLALPGLVEAHTHLDKS